MTVKYVLEVGDMVKDKSDSIRFLVLCQSWILGEGYCPQSSPSTPATLVIISLLRGDWQLKVEATRSYVNSSACARAPLRWCRIFAVRLRARASENFPTCRRGIAPRHRRLLL